MYKHIDYNFIDEPIDNNNTDFENFDTKNRAYWEITEEEWDKINDDDIWKITEKEWEIYKGYMELIDELSEKEEN